MTAQSLTHIAAEAHRHDLEISAERRRAYAAARVDRRRSGRRFEVGGLRRLRARPV